MVAQNIKKHLDIFNFLGSALFILSAPFWQDTKLHLSMMMLPSEPPLYSVMLTEELLKLGKLHWSLRIWPFDETRPFITNLHA